MGAALTDEQQRVLAWADAHRRDLPWRDTRDPWAVLVSEVMLQQTQVDRVVHRWQRFLDRWPDTSACATASLADVLGEWQGLGYPRRAKALHSAAQEIQDHHGGRFPDRLEQLLALPGIGPYTARAVLAFAFEQDVAVLDTNVGRILARRSGGSLTPRVAQASADAWVPSGHGWAWNQAMLDLGATVCGARTPSCGSCPVSRGCAWFEADRPAPDPAVGSAGVSTRQSAFDGSDSQGRGRIVSAMRTGPVPLAQLAQVAGWPDDPERARRVADGLVADGLAERVGEDLSLPGGAL